MGLQMQWISLWADRNLYSENQVIELCPISKIAMDTSNNTVDTGYNNVPAYNC